GRYAWHMPFEAIQLKERSSGIPTDLAALCGKRFVTASESNRGVRLNEAILKSLTGEDPITARHLYKNWFEFQPAAKYWLFTNFKPRVADSSFGFWRRVRLIEWTQRFDGTKDDKNLEQKLKKELPGILAWIVCGCVEWQKRGLIVPEAIVDATKEYEIESDRYAEFLSEYCAQGVGCATFATEFYDGYKRWALANGLSEKERTTQTSFGRDMAERFKKIRSKGRVLYEGVELRSEFRGGSNG